MKEEIIKKYVKDLNGLLKEMEGEFVSQTSIVVGESAVIFMFGRIFRYLNFFEFIIGHDKALGNRLDAWGMLGNDRDILIEFEPRSKNFEEHIKKGDVKPEDYKNILIVCWDDNWKERPSEIDVLEIEPLWKQAN
jgi:hypothetical protein